MKIAEIAEIAEALDEVWPHLNDELNDLIVQRAAELRQQ